MFPTFNKADVTFDGDGMQYLHLELQVIIDGKTIIMISDFPATSNFKPQNPPDPAPDRGARHQ